jgi:hypothetical protein
VTAAQLVKGAVTAEEVLCGTASVDYACGTAMPSWAKYVTVYCGSAVIVAMGEATSGSVGVYVAGGQPTMFTVTPSGTANDDKPHVQSTWGTMTVRFTYQAD